MFEIVWRIDPNIVATEHLPQSAAAARARLDAGSAGFAAMSAEKGRYVVNLPLGAFGMSALPGAAIAHEPFAAVLGCSDARAPVEMIFGLASNDLFTVRVAGNVPGTECLGSLDYAVAQLHSLRLLAVLGHTGCGAVTAAVDAYLSPDTYFEVAANPNLRAIVDEIMAAVTTSAAALADVHGLEVAKQSGFRAVLIETAIVVNAALTASLINRGLDPVRSKTMSVAFGIYDLARRSVGLPVPGGWQPGLADPPESAAALTQLAHRTAEALYSPRS